MNIEDLIAHGGFVSDEPVKRTVIWKKRNDSGEQVELKFEVFIKRHSFGAIEKVWSVDGDKSKAAAFISQSILFGEKGDQKLSYEKAFQLDPGLASVFISEINDVNDTGGDVQKN